MRRAAPGLVLLVLLGVGLWYSWGSWSWFGGRTPADETPPPLPPPLTYATKPEVGFLAPDFLLKTIDGRQGRLSDHLGVVVALNFWTSRCPFCAAELQNFSRLASEHGGRLVVVAVNRGEPPVTVEGYFARYGRPGGVVFLMDPEDSISDRYGVTALPETFFIDRQGVIRDYQPGELTLEDMRGRVRPLLEAASDPAGSP